MVTRLPNARYNPRHPAIASANRPVESLPQTNVSRTARRVHVADPRAEVAKRVQAPLYAENTHERMVNEITALSARHKRPRNTQKRQKSLVARVR